MEVASSDHKHRTENVSGPKLHHLIHLHHETTSPTGQQMHARDFCGFSQCLSATPVAHHCKFSIFRTQSSQNSAAFLCITPRFHLTLLTIVVFAEPLFSLFGMTCNMITLQMFHRNASDLDLCVYFSFCYATARIVNVMFRSENTLKSVVANDAAGKPPAFQPAPDTPSGAVALL